jgi:hypothetical protein
VVSKKKQYALVTLLWAITRRGRARVRATEIAEEDQTLNLDTTAPRRKTNSRLVTGRATTVGKEKTNGMQRRYYTQTKKAEA